MGLTLATALRLRAPQGLADQAIAMAFAGAGGKTTAMFRLARELPSPVIVTASTHLAESQVSLADRHVTAKPGEILDLEPVTEVTLVTGPLGADGRLAGLESNQLIRLNVYCAYRRIPLLIEADGARERALKAPAQHEPVIPDFVQVVIIVAGLSALGKSLGPEVVHRPEIFAELSGLKLGAAISTSSIVNVLSHPLGGMKNIPPFARRVVLLNQADAPELQGSAREMVRPLLNNFDAVVIAAMRQQAVYAAREPVAGIVLAAGESRRFGQPKQLLDWDGQPFIRIVTRTAMAAGLSPVIVVTGAEAEPIEAAITDLNIAIARNADWREGQATSIRVGLDACPSRVGAAVFLLADQPQIPAAAISGLIEMHASGLYPIVAPLVLGERRGNPVLFDRTTFAALRALRGDVGGRAIFGDHPVQYMPWHDESLLADIDTAEDYRRLLEKRLS